MAGSFRGVIWKPNYRRSFVIPHLTESEDAWSCIHFCSLFGQSPIRWYDSLLDHELPEDRRCDLMKPFSSFFISVVLTSRLGAQGAQ